MGGGGGGGWAAAAAEAFMDARMRFFQLVGAELFEHFRHACVKGRREEGGRETETETERQRNRREKGWKKREGDKDKE